MKYSAKQCLRDNIIVILSACAILTLLFFFIAFAFPPVHMEPREGIWYCDELNIQLSYEEDVECFIIVNNQKTICVCGSDRGANRIEVICQEHDNPYYIFEESVFSAKILSLDDENLVVYDDKAEIEYTFVRIG